MINSFEKYLNRYCKYEPRILKKPSNNLGIIITIPAYNEPNIQQSIQSILNAEKPSVATEIIVIINHTETTPNNIKEQNINSYTQLTEFAKKHNNTSTQIHVLLEENLTKKHSGVGLSRKIAMDEAIYRFNKVDNNKGIIISLDADTLISENYFTEVERAFIKNKGLNVAIPHFTHNTNGLPKNEKVAIIKYELYLKYFRLALRYTGFPYAFHTIGSAFSVTAQAYVKQGGMNKKQGGEDFYFLHKIFQLGNTIELTNATVFPSGRISDRVPFGTGPAVKSIINEGCWITYNPILFKHLKQLFNSTDKLFNADNNAIKTVYNSLDLSIKQFIPLNEFNNKIEEINNNSTNLNSFTNRFFVWFNAFKIVKYLNFSQQTHKGLDVQEAIKDFFKLSENIDLKEYSEAELLTFLDTKK